MIVVITPAILKNKNFNPFSSSPSSCAIMDSATLPVVTIPPTQPKIRRAHLPVLQLHDREVVILFQNVILML